MVGRTNAIAAGGGELVTAFTSKSIPSDGTRTYITLTCDFDPLVVYAEGPNYFGDLYENESRYRLTKEDAWQYSGFVKSNNQSPTISISGRTVTVSFRTNDGGTGYLRAWGFPD